MFRWNVGSYYSILINLVLGVGATFESPLLIILLVWLGIVSTATLRQYRRHAIVAIFIVAAIITPTQDPFLQTLFAAPLCLLFEIALLVATRIEKRRDRSGAAALVALLALWPRRQTAPDAAGLAQ